MNRFLTKRTLPFFALPCFRGELVLTPAQRCGRTSSAQCASRKVTTGHK